MKVRLLASFLLLNITTGFNVYADSHNTGSNGIEYTYGEVRFVDVDGGDGIEIGGSYRINEQFYGVASYQDLDGSGTSAEILEIGGGFIYPHKKADLAVEFTFLDVDFPGGSESGYSLAAGGRSFLSPEFEVRAYVKHVDIVNSDTFIEVGGGYFLNTNLSVGITLEVASDDDTLTFGGRYYF